MKAILEFNLDDPHDVNSHKRCINATNAYIAFNEIFNFLRTENKYRELTPEQSEYLSYISENIYAIIDNNEVNLNDLE